MSDDYYEQNNIDELEELSNIHPALRIIVGFILISFIWLLYIIFYPMWIYFVDTIMMVVGLIPSSDLTGLVNASGGAPTFYNELSLSVSAAFIIIFTGVIIFFLIIPAIKR